MATYLPANHIAAKALGNGSANIGTWQLQNTLGASTFHIHRTTVFQDPNGASVTVEAGSVAATTTAQQIINAEVITAHVQYMKNWWVAIPNSSYFGAFANTATCNGATSGYTFS